MLARHAPIPLLALALACGGDPTPKAQTPKAKAEDKATAPAAVSEETIADKAAAETIPPQKSVAPSTYNLPVPIRGWKTWTKINSEHFLSKSHNKTIVDIYVDKEHADQYRARSGPMAIGTSIVKAQWGNDAGVKGKPENLTVMVKMESGFDPQRGDWYYGVYTFDGQNVLIEGKSDGKTAMCSTCHDSADVDYTFGAP